MYASGKYLDTSWTAYSAAIELALRDICGNDRNAAISELPAAMGPVLFIQYSSQTEALYVAFVVIVFGLGKLGFVRLNIMNTKTLSCRFAPTAGRFFLTLTPAAFSTPLGPTPLT